MEEFELVPDTSWDGMVEAGRLHPDIRLVASLIDAGDFEQLFRRTGIRARPDGSLDGAGLPLFLELETHGKDDTLARLTTTTKANNGDLRIAATVLEEFSDNPHLTVVPARFSWSATAVPATTPSRPTSGFRSAIAALIRDKGVRRVSLPNPLQPCLVESLADIDMPQERRFGQRILDGTDVVVGIIDDGCALAHRNFLVPGTNASRIRYLWHQGRTAADGGAGWVNPAQAQNATSFDGLELDKPAIDAALAARTLPNGLIDEERVYADLAYPLDLASHGTHVMDIAAGNGTALMGSEGVARAAHIVFVQLPTQLVEEGGPLLEDRIQEGVQYILDRAEKMGFPAVVNISYGGYSGPHDGTSPLASAIDALLAARDNCAVVVSAGNGFEADCHARQEVDAQKPARTLQWNMSPEDPTPNQMEIWYASSARLELRITPPGRPGPLPPVRLNEAHVLKRASDGLILGWIENVPTTSGAHPNVIRIRVNGTVGERASKVKSKTAGPQQQKPPLTAPAPSGTWQIDLLNYGSAPATFHAWIARDDLRRRGDRRRQQSFFPPEQADPGFTIADLATGHLALCVGAHNTATEETCGYSACGPTRDGRQKPDLTAPAEEDAARRGILCASSRRAAPSRFNGTSAAAPHVAGLVALLLQYNRDRGRPALTARRIRDLVMGGATKAKLRPDRHQEVDPHRPPGKKQADHFGAVTGAGKADITGSLLLLP